MISQNLCLSFKAELLKGYHAFAAGARAADTFKLALYTSSADLSLSTTSYTSVGEVVGTGYTGGGKVLAPTVAYDGSTAYVTFAALTWGPTASFTARGALIYNASQGNRSVAVLNFGSDKIATSTFEITFPAATASTALIRVS